MRFPCRLRAVGLSLLLIISALVAIIPDTYAADTCTAAVAVSIQGTVEVRRHGETMWQPVLMNARLCYGDMIRTRLYSRASLRLSNQSMLRLDQKTAVTLSEPGKDNPTLLDLITGIIHVITRTPTPFNVRTPFVNAGIEGTEFLVNAGQHETTLTLYEGKILASNNQGSLTLNHSGTAITTSNQAPRMTTPIHPVDAVQWALHYPVIIHYQPDDIPPPDRTTLRAAMQAYQQGRLIDALTVLDTAYPDKYTPQSLAYHAELLLSAGRVEEARAVIAQILRLQPDNSDAYTLQAIIAIVRNDRQQATVLAQQAVELDPASAAARLALAYVHQAYGRIDEALTSVKEAIRLAPQHALAWARLAELHMSSGDNGAALDAAKRAISLDPDVSRTHTVLGFSHLIRIDTKAAKTTFTRAIELDQTDPLPRLGMGLALIREGNLEAGRIEMEIAASLDPAGSLIRSYLGKAYFEEKRYALSADQFDMAKKRDPNDPTPWLYSAMQKQTQNQPGEALKDLEKSVQLNDNRAVYRSRLLLDQDQAARGSSLARIYDDLGFRSRALMETARSLSFDPASHSSHRFLSDAYLDMPRHEIARVSELLQAQLLQPVNINPVQPRLAVTDLNIISGIGPGNASFNEFTPLTQRNRPQLNLSGIAGSYGTLGNEAVISGVWNRASVSIGQFHYDTNGFRQNNDQAHNIYNAFVQFALTPDINFQAEVRTRGSRHGDLLLDFDPKVFTQNRRKLEEDTARVGARWAISPRQDLIASAIYLNRRESNHFPDPIINAHAREKDQGYQTEAQYLLRQDYFNITAGGGIYQIDTRNHLQAQLTLQGQSLLEQQNGLPPGTLCIFLPSVCDPFSSTVPARNERTSAYLYTNFHYPRNTNITLGLSHDFIKEGVDFRSGHVNPKFGFQWNITPSTRFRLAWFQTVKSALVANQTLEPTQVAGFNQLFDDVNGTRARRMGVGLDTRFGGNLFAGVEASERALDVPLFDLATLALERAEKQHEQLYRSYLYWLPHVHWSVRGEFQFEKFTRTREDLSGTQDPWRIQTLTSPLSIQYFHPAGPFARLTSTYVRQQLDRRDTTSNAGVNDFVLLDATLGYRLPKRWGILSFEGRNLLNENFFYRNINFQQSEAINPRFVPVRTFFVRLTLNF